MCRLSVALVLLLVFYIAASSSFVAAQPCEEIWFHNYSWCGKNGNTSCAPYNGMCKPSCDGTEYMSCDQMPWCTVIKNNGSGPVCRPNCEAITDSDACWSTTHYSIADSQDIPSCWFYNGKCMPACSYYSDNKTFCLTSTYASYCIWDSVASRCHNDASIAVDYESCNMLFALSDINTAWSFRRRTCGSNWCSLQPNQTACNALGSRCQWYPSAATNGDTTGSCLDNCSEVTTGIICNLLNGCYWLGGSCKRACSNVNVFPTKDDPKKYNTSQCDALDYCGVTVGNKCSLRNCSAVQSREECDYLPENCVYVAGSCVSSCSANSSFADVPCSSIAHDGVSICEWNSGYCQPVDCGAFTTLGRDACYSLGPGGFYLPECMFYNGTCQKACERAHNFWLMRLVS